MSTSRAVVTLDKTWHMEGSAGAYSGAAREQLILFRMADGAWRIADERELQVYRVSASP